MERNETTQNAITSWSFGDNLVRTVTGTDGEPWFVGVDVATALGYSNTRDAIATHVDEDDRATVAFRDGSQNRTKVIINESGLYSLIFGSKLDEAKKFKKWVTSEVLPQIRKTGSYKKDELLSFKGECVKLIDDRLSEMKPWNAETGRLSATAKLMRQQIEMMSRVESLVDKGLIKKEDFQNVIEGFSKRARTLEPIVNLRQRELEENGKILAFAQSKLDITGNDSDYIRSSDLYTLYLNETEGDVVKEFTFKNRFEMMFPSVTYASKTIDGCMEYVVLGAKAKVER